MYFPNGWPRVVKLPEVAQYDIKQITCNRDRVLFAFITCDILGVWFCKPCVPIVIYRRNAKSLEKFGANISVEWKPDSSMLVVATSEGHLLFYKLEIIYDQKGLYVQTDSPHANLRRDSAELFVKEVIPPLKLSLSLEITVWDGKITGLVCITMSELMLATTEGHVLRYRWDGTQYRDYNLDLRRIPFCINQQVSKAIPIVEDNTFIIDIEYSPLVGGFAIVLNDGRAALLTASSLKFDPNQVQGIWAQGLEDATCTRINHKYKLITFGRSNSECIVYNVDESTGGLEVSHTCALSTKDFPGEPGAVSNMLWTPDGCALVISWGKGGIGMWSTFGALLMCSLAWDYGLFHDIQKFNPLQVVSMEFSAEGYQLWMIQKESEDNGRVKTNLIQLDFIKSALTINPCMSHQSHLYLQGEDRLFVNSADTLVKIFSERSQKDENLFTETSSINTLAEGRQWLIIPVPAAYSCTNWPVRYSAIDIDGQNMAIAGRTGLAHYSMQTRKWKLFGNETQEKDFIVTGGLLWWWDYIVMGCYSILENSDEIRFYARDSKLDNKFAKIVRVTSPILLINILQEQMITFNSDGEVHIWGLNRHDGVGDIDVYKLQVIDISSLAVHPACIVSITLTSLKTELSRNQNSLLECLVINASGKLLMVQRENRTGDRYTCSMPTILASCVENVWAPVRKRLDKVHLTEALWLFCGSHGMRVWLPLFPKHNNKNHTFMSKRIMLPFHLKIYPLVILFEDAIILGAENDTVLYTSDTNSPFSLPFNVLQRTNQVYLHQILRQLIRRNLGYHAWEIAQSCMSLPYFPHSLELLLHEVLEEEATSKEPIPDAQLPSVIEFIMEFPVYLQTIVQCARKTEIALWPYLFSATGKPKDLFQECMLRKELETAASYLLILQNLETSAISRQYATLLLNTALDLSKWEIAKDLVRFLRAIDPNDVESPRNSLALPTKLGLPAQTPTVSPNAEDIFLILGNVQGSRVRSYSTTILPKIADHKNNNTTNTHSSESPDSGRKKLGPGGTSSVQSDKGHSAEEFFIDVILQKHARRLLSAQRLTDLGYFAAYLDFHLVTWLAKERERVARVDDCVKALKLLHEEFVWPYPHCTTQSGEVPPFFEAGNMEDRLKALKAGNYINSSSIIGDSGYLSFQGQPCAGIATSSNLDSFSQTTRDNELVLNNNENGVKNVSNLPQLEDDCIYRPKNFIYEADLSSKHLPTFDESIMSTVSSTWGDEADKVNIGTENWDIPSTQILEHLNNMGSKGSQKSEVQLRYLLQLFLEASCLEWSLIIAVLLRDVMAVLRTVNAAKSQDQSVNSVIRLRQELILLHYWTNTECMGYKTFMMAIQNQVNVLTKIMETKMQQQILERQGSSLSLQVSVNKCPSSPNITNVTSASQITSAKEKRPDRISTSYSNDKKHSISSLKGNSSNVNDDNPTLPQSTGCIIS